ncbi:M43 family zinc metalloprotease [Niabella sp.]|uniref:M43 family zinc metalloprotease n=1 Tax=Niabella sp. TaxID=1962976 RepID=UPI002637DCAE|nr:M43 family zinc metalloprotease [Niabella sp.]
MSTFFKKNRSFLIVLLLLLSVSPKAGAQKKEVCGFDARLKRQMASPQIAQQIIAAGTAISRKQDVLKNLRQTSKNREVLPGPVYQIPVVVHVLYRPADAVPGAPGTPNAYDDNSTDHPTDAAINSMINFLNQVYAGQYASGGISTPIRFVLAKRDPNCNATTGIVRTKVTDSRYVADGLRDGSTGPGMPEAELLALSKWPRNEYYNIWIVHKIGDGGTNGYAYFPNRYNEEDGTVLDARVVNGTALTLPHEIGHALALYHTFESKTNGDEESICPVNANPNTDGDEVADTDPHKKSWTCFAPGTINDCTNQAWGNSRTNIMSYFSCRDRFTPGQGDRLQATMLTERYSLISSLGDQPPSGIAVTSIDHKTVVSEPDNGFGMGPLLVKLNTMYYQSDAYRSTSKIAYEDKTCTIGTTLSKTGSYTIEVSTGLNQQRVKVWLDLNNDGLYGSGELVGSSNPSTGGDYTHSIAIPPAVLSSATVLNTPLRMRVAADYGGSPDYSYNSELEYGQMEDFAVTITDAVLPVQFGVVTAVLNNGLLKVNWTSESEVNNEKYLVQVSKDGNIFYTIGEQKSLAPSGNSDTAVAYSFSMGMDRLGVALAGLALLGLLSFPAGSKKKYRVYMAALMVVAALIAGHSCNKREKEFTTGTGGDLYVRVAQVDKEGSIGYSKVVKVIKE